MRHEPNDLTMMYYSYITTVKTRTCQSQNYGTVVASAGLSPLALWGSHRIGRGKNWDKNHEANSSSRHYLISLCLFLCTTSSLCLIAVFSPCCLVFLLSSFTDDTSSLFQGSELSWKCWGLRRCWQCNRTYKSSHKNKCVSVCVRGYNTGFPIQNETLWCRVL